MLYLVTNDWDNNEEYEMQESGTEIAGVFDSIEKAKEAVLKMIDDANKYYTSEYEKSNGYLSLEKVVETDKNFIEKPNSAFELCWNYCTSYYEEWYSNTVRIQPMNINERIDEYVEQE